MLFTLVTRGKVNMHDGGMEERVKKEKEAVIKTRTIVIIKMRQIVSLKCVRNPL